MRRPRKNICAAATAWASLSITPLLASDLDSAIEHFQRAIELDPNFALAYSALGSCYVNRVLKGLGEAKRSRESREGVQQGAGSRSQAA